MCNLSDYVDKVGMKKGLEHGIEALILDNQEERKTEDEIVEKLMKRFPLSRQEAKEYFERFAKLTV